MSGWLPGGDVATATAVLLILLTIGIGSAALVRRLAKRSGEQGPRAVGGGGHTGPLLRAVGETITTLKEKQDTLAQLREKAERRAEEAEGYSALILTAIPTAVMGFDPALRVQSVNPAATHLLRTHPSVAIGRHCTELFEDDGGLQTALQECLEGVSTGQARELRVKRGDGRPLVLEARLALWGGEREKGVLAVLTDITAAKALERRVRLKESLAAAGEMAAGLSHQVRNSLAALAGYARLLRAKGGSPGQVERLAGRVEREVKELDRVTGDFLRFARPEELHAEAIDINTFVEEIVEGFREELESRSIKVGRKSEGCDVRLRLDRRLFREALGNLVRNAVEAMPSGGEFEIDVVAAVEPNEVWVTVCDTGEGLGGRDIQELLRPFYTTKKRGIGLGLSVVEKVVTLHGGRLSCWERQGGGSAFRVTLPLEDQALS
jgi:PAS domain S-box-containing protein